MSILIFCVKVGEILLLAGDGYSGPHLRRSVRRNIVISNNGGPSQEVDGGVELEPGPEPDDIELGGL